jgi:hypothetical protein
LNYREAPTLKSRSLGFLSGEWEIADIGTITEADGYYWLPLLRKGAWVYVAYSRIDPQAMKTPMILIEAHGIMGFMGKPTLARGQTRGSLLPIHTNRPDVVWGLAGLSGERLAWDDKGGFGFAKFPALLATFEALYVRGASIKPLYFFIHQEQRAGGDYYAFITDDMRLTENGDPHYTLGGWRVQEWNVNELLGRFELARKAQ